MKKALNLKKVALLSLLSMFFIGTFLIVSCNKEEAPKTQTEEFTKKSASSGFGFPDGKYYMNVNGNTVIFYIMDENIERMIDEATGEIIDPDKADFRTFPGNKEGEDAAMKFIDSINGQQDCITMRKSDVTGPNGEAGWVWLVSYGCD